MRRLILICLIAFGAIAADARACSCVDTGTVLTDAERVFVGTVIERRGSEMLAVYTIDVEQVVSGDVPDPIRLRAGTQEASCGVDLPVGRRVGVMLTQPGDEVNLCQIADPDELGVEVPSPASLLGALLGTCWSVL